MPCRNLGVDVVAVVRAITGEGCHRLLHLLEQGAGLRAVVRILVGQPRRDDPARVSVRGEMQLTPATPPHAGMLLNQPLAGSTKLQSRAVYQQVHRLACPPSVAAPPASRPG